MHPHKILNIASQNKHLQNTLSKELGISKVFAQVLINRGIHSPPAAQDFLKASCAQLLDPYSFADMPKAVALIRKAAERKEKVILFGDYDVDGVTSVALLKGTFSRIGLDTLHYLPHRIKDGYGLTKDIIEAALAAKARLLITADCGTSDHQRIKELRSKNIDVIVTDHHEPADSGLPEASCIINPKVKGCRYKYRELAGVGVAYKLCQALTNDVLFDELDLVSLGTVADVVPLTGENRVLAKEGLKRLADTKRPGLKALMETSGISNKKISTGFISFILGPRLNAGGRMDSAQVSLDLLMAATPEEALPLARLIEAHNRQRQKIEGRIMEEAQDIINREINFKEHKVIVIAKEDWHQGVLGIVAAKLADKFYRPVIVISKSAGLCKGSGRSIKNFHLFQALSECAGLLKAFGGHAHAAGLSIDKNSIDQFRQNINRLAKEKLKIEDLLPALDIDMELSLADLNGDLAAELEMLEPFGAGNSEPLFYTRGLRLKGQPQLLSRNTLKFFVTDGALTYPAIGFGLSDFKDSLVNADILDLVYLVRIDRWQGGDSIILEVEDIFFR